MFTSLALVPALALTAAPARAADNEGETSQLEIRYHDLDLTTAKGRNQLEMRLHRAAATVCGYDDGDRATFDIAAGRTCYNTALAHAHTALAAAQSAHEVVTR